MLRLDPVVEPEPVSWALASAPVGDVTVTDVAEVEAVLAVLDGGSCLADATAGACLDELADRGLDVIPATTAPSRRSPSPRSPPPPPSSWSRAENGWAAARLAAVPDRLVPGVPRVPFDPEWGLLDPLSRVPASARRGQVRDAHAPLLRGAPPREPDCGVALTLFTDRRSFHPGRLYRVIDALLEGVVHTRGRAWVASQPDVALWLESAGGGCGSAVLSHEATPAEIVATLRDALLTDSELAGGESAWRHYPDPFGHRHAETVTDRKGSA